VGVTRHEALIHQALEATFAKLVVEAQQVLLPHLVYHNTHYKFGLLPGVGAGTKGRQQSKAANDCQRL